jgi:transposase
MLTIPTKYSEEFKRDAVGLVESGIAQRQVCRDLGISKSALAAWAQDARFKTYGLTPPKGPEEQREMRQALKRIRGLDMENEVLRRAAAHLSQIHITPQK